MAKFLPDPNSPLAKEFDDHIKAAHQSVKAVSVSFWGFDTHTNQPKTFLSPKELSAVLGCSLKTLERWRKKGEGPPYKKIGKHIRYAKKALDFWWEEPYSVNNVDGELDLS